VSCSFFDLAGLCHFLPFPFFSFLSFLSFSFFLFTFPQVVEVDGLSSHVDQLDLNFKYEQQVDQLNRELGESGRYLFFFSPSFSYIDQLCLAKLQVEIDRLEVELKANESKGDDTAAFKSSKQLHIKMKEKENLLEEKNQLAEEQMAEAKEQMAEAKEQMAEVKEQMAEAKEQMAEAEEQMAEAEEQMAEAEEQNRLTARASAVMGYLEPSASKSFLESLSLPESVASTPKTGLRAEKNFTAEDFGLTLANSGDLVLPTPLVDEILGDFRRLGENRESIVPEAGDHENFTQVVYNRVLTYIAQGLGSECLYDVEDHSATSGNDGSRKKMDLVFRLKDESRKVLPTVVFFLELKSNLGEKQNEVDTQCEARVKMMLACQPDRTKVAFLQGDFSTISAWSSELNIIKSVSNGGYVSSLQTVREQKEQFW